MTLKIPEKITAEWLRSKRDVFGLPMFCHGGIRTFENLFPKNGAAPTERNFDRLAKVMSWFDLRYFASRVLSPAASRRMYGELLRGEISSEEEEDHRRLQVIKRAYANKFGWGKKPATARKTKSRRKAA